MAGLFFWAAKGRGTERAVRAESRTRRRSDPSPRRG